MPPTRRVGVGVAVLVTATLLAALLATGALGLATPAEPASGVDAPDETVGADSPDADSRNGDAAGTTDGIERETPVITSEPKFEPAATPEAPGNDTVNSTSA